MNPMMKPPSLATGPRPSRMKKKKNGKKVSSDTPTALHELPPKKSKRYQRNSQRHGPPPMQYQPLYPNTQPLTGVYREPPIAQQPTPPPGFVTIHVKVPTGLSPHRMMIANTNFGYPVQLIVPSGLPPGAIFAVFVPSPPPPHPPTNTTGGMPPPPPPQPHGTIRPYSPPSPPPFPAAHAAAVGMLPPPPKPPPPPPSMSYGHPPYPPTGQYWESGGNAGIGSGYQEYGIPQYSYY